MSDHDDTLLDEDLGDEEYDLGNDEEEALLADDYELERQNSYKGEEETDDVLDLGVTDALDDLEGDDENIEYRSETDNRNQNDFYKEEHPENKSAYYEQEEQEEYKEEQSRRYEENIVQDGIAIQSSSNKGDLREKLQKNIQKDFYIGNGQGLEDDDCEEAKERRNRFQNERTMISPKMNNDIPDSLENVVTAEQARSFKGRGRGRGVRGNRGGRFNAPISGNFNQSFNTPRGSALFDNQHLPYRPPLLDSRHLFRPGLVTNLPSQPAPYPQNSPQVTPFQQFSPNDPLQGPAHFVDNRPSFNPSQFQGPIGPPGPRIGGARLDFIPRGPIPGPILPFNCLPNQPPYLQNQLHLQNQGLPMPDNHGRPIQGNQSLLMQGNPGGPMHGNPGPPSIPGNQGPLIQGNQGVPMQGFPRPPAPNQVPTVQNHPNAQLPNQVPFENRAPFQEPHFEGRPIYDSRPMYNDQPPVSQFNNGVPILPQPPQSSPNVPNVPLPPGHKILINPHFRGAVQPTSDARLVWDSSQQQQQQQQPLLQPQIPSEQFIQLPTPYQNQSSYNQTSAPRDLPDYQPSYQRNRSDDPYAYFSDVWQENKPQKSPSVTSNKPYSVESNYSRDNSYNDYEDKYKSESQWEHRDSYQQTCSTQSAHDTMDYSDGQRGQHQNYHDRDPLPRSKSDYVQRNRVASSNATYRNENYIQSHTQRPPSNRPLNTSGKGVSRMSQKRISETLERDQRDTSPKRVKTNSRNLHEVRTLYSDSNRSRKEEENEDPEMREYRKKMDEQKRLREKLLREKENRRKMAAMEKQSEVGKGDTTTAEFSQQETKPVSVMTGIVKDTNTITKIRPIASRGHTRPVSAQATEGTERASGVRIVRTIQTVQPNTVIDNDNVKDVSSAISTVQAIEAVRLRQLVPQSGMRRVVIHKPLPNAQKVATTIQKTVSNLQKGQSNVQTIIQKVIQNPQGIVKKSSGMTQKFASNDQKCVAQKVLGGLQKTVINMQDVVSANAQKVVVSTQNNQRVLLQKPPCQPKKPLEIKTNTVKIENLAASTTEAQIRRMCYGIGTLESIRMGEGNATIVFKTQSAALVFHKKYQRKMLDLSLITVRLVPQTVGNKATAIAVKKS